MTAAGVAVNNTNKKVVFKNCAPLTDCITQINNTQVDEAQNIIIILYILYYYIILFEDIGKFMAIL